MTLHRIHYISGLVITAFVALHLINHCFSISGAEKHIEIMTALRHFYRNIFVETILLMAVAIQIFSGIQLFRANRKAAKTFFEKLQIWTGLYLAIFFLIHVSAVFAGRFILQLDTNFYFGVAGLNSFPVNLFFIPYYALAIIAFFGHIAAIHHRKMKKNIVGIPPILQSKLIIVFGVCLAIVIFYGLTNDFRGVQIPPEYKVLTGK